jgi:hypothetical protein
MKIRRRNSTAHPTTTKEIDNWGDVNMTRREQEQPTIALFPKQASLQVVPAMSHLFFSFLFTDEQSRKRA